MENIWLKNPLAMYTGNDEDARGGIVIQGDKVIELISLGHEPSHKIDTVIDASQHVVTPG